jgi:hypothetical protein
VYKNGHEIDFVKKKYWPTFAQFRGKWETFDLVKKRRKKERKK